MMEYSVHNVDLEDRGRVTIKYCPYLGVIWDSSIPFTVPDSGNRCYAQTHRIRRFWIFHKRVPGSRIAMTLQQNACYRKFTFCPYYIQAEALKK